MDYSYQSLELYMVPLRADNYSYVIHDRAKNKTLVIDPSETEPLIKFLKAHHFGLDLIIDTHHHNDHSEGNLGLQAAFDSAIVCSDYDHEKNRIPGKVRQTLKDGDTLTFSDYEFQVYGTPGHTLGHICLLLKGAHWLFCGDTLFALGCGRLFEGDPATMWESFKKLRSLPDDSLVFCGHEYTLSNARFAQHIAPNLEGLHAYVDDQKQRQVSEGRTVPSRLEDEKKYNPFFLADAPVMSRLGSNPVEIFGSIRKQKDNFQ